METVKDPILLKLQSEFETRANRNPQYSLRSFAKSLDVDQSLLTKILKGQRKPTIGFVSKVGPKIGLTPSMIKKISKSHQVESESTFLDIENDEFEVISGWQHFAILELMKTQDFEFSSSWISKRLGLHEVQIQSALDRLLRLGYFRVFENNRIELLKRDNTWASLNSTTEAKRKLQKHWTEKSLEALDEVPFERRSHSSLTIAIDSKRMPEFREKLQNLRREFGDFAGDAGDQMEVYQLSIGFYPLTKRGEGK